MICIAYKYHSFTATHYIICHSLQRTTSTFEYSEKVEADSMLFAWLAIAWVPFAITARYFHTRYYSKMISRQVCHKHTHTQAHARARTHTHTHAHTHTQAHTCTHAYTHTHARTHTYTHVYTHSHTNTQAHTNTRKNTRTHAHAYTYTCTYTHTHTHTRTHIHTHRREGKRCAHCITRAAPRASTSAATTS